MINSKLSDILGRKLVFISCIFFFTAFSGACAAANTIDQLYVVTIPLSDYLCNIYLYCSLLYSIVFRAFQGIGGGGSYALGSIMLIQIVPASEITKMASYSSISFVVATVLGPIIGGGICQHTTWRWIFLFNVPIGVFAMVIAMIGIPNGYPHHHKAVKPQMASFSEMWMRIDVLGCTLLLLSTLAFASAFQEVNSQFSWDSAYFIVLIIASLLLCALLLLWERRVAVPNGHREPVLPWRFIVRREMLGTLLYVIPLLLFIREFPSN